MFWSSKAPPPTPEPKKEEEEPIKVSEDLLQKASQEFDRFNKQLESDPIPVIALFAFCFGFACSTGGSAFYRRYVKRIQNAEWVTPDIVGRKRWIRGVVTRVGDPDNFHIFHTPPCGGWHGPLKFRAVPKTKKGLQGKTVKIRVAGVDAPEMKNFEKAEQPYAQDSLEWLRRRILGKVVYCQLVRRDHYSRVVANVHLAPRALPGAYFYGENLALDMLREGCATIYEQAGAVYGKEGKEEYLRLEAEAKKARKGMWAEGVTIETPAEYKRRMRAGEESEPESPSETPEPEPEPQCSWFMRLFFR